MKRTLFLALAVPALLLATGCTGTDPSATPSATTSAASASATSTYDPNEDPAIVGPPPEGPADKPVTWPDGITLTLVKVEKMDRALGTDVGADETVIRVTATIRNGGGEAFPLPPGLNVSTVLSGPNGTAGEDDPGRGGDPATILQNESPRRIAAGESITSIESSTVPTAELGVLAVEFRLPLDGLGTVRNPYTFTGVEKILR